MTNPELARAALCQGKVRPIPNEQQPRGHVLLDAIENIHHRFDAFDRPKVGYVNHDLCPLIATSEMAAKIRPRPSSMDCAIEEVGDDGDVTRHIEFRVGGLAKAIRHSGHAIRSVSYTHLRAHETGRNLVCRLLLEKK